LDRRNSRGVKEIPAGLAWRRTACTVSGKTVDILSPASCAGSVRSIEKHKRPESIESTRGLSQLTITTISAKAKH